MFENFGCMPLWQTTCQGLRTIHGGGGSCCASFRDCCEGTRPKSHLRPVSTPPTPELSPLPSVHCTDADRDSLGGGPPECERQDCPTRKRPESYADLHRRSAHFYERHARSCVPRSPRSRREADECVGQCGGEQTKRERRHGHGRRKRGQHDGDAHVHGKHVHEAHTHPAHMHKGRFKPPREHGEHVHGEHIHEEHTHGARRKPKGGLRDPKPCRRGPKQCTRGSSATRDLSPLRPCDGTKRRAQSAKCCPPPCVSSSSSGTSTTSSSSTSSSECSEGCEWPFGCKFSCAEPTPEYTAKCPGGGMMKRCAGKVGDGTRGWGTLIQKTPPEMKPYNPGAPCGMGLPCGYRSRGKVYLPGPPGQVCSWTPCRPNPCGVPAICCKPCCLPPLQPTPPGFITPAPKHDGGGNVAPQLSPAPFGANAPPGAGLPVNTSMSAIVALSLIAANHATGGPCSCPAHSMPPGSTPMFPPVPTSSSFMPAGCATSPSPSSNAPGAALRLTQSEDDTRQNPFSDMVHRQHSNTPIQVDTGEPGLPTDVSQLTSTGRPFLPESWQPAMPGALHPAAASGTPNLGCGPFTPNAVPGFPPIPHCVPDSGISTQGIGRLRGGGGGGNLKGVSPYQSSPGSPGVTGKQSVTFASVGSNSSSAMYTGYPMSPADAIGTQGGACTGGPDNMGGMNGFMPAFNPPMTTEWQGTLCPNPLKMEICGAPVPPQYVNTGPCSTFAKNLTPCGARPKLRQTCTETSNVKAPKCRDGGRMVTCGSHDAKDKCGICKLMFDESCPCGRRRRAGPCAPWCLQPKPADQLSRFEKQKMKGRTKHRGTHGCQMPLVLPWQKQKRRNIGKVFEQLEKEKPPLCMEKKWVQPCSLVGECLAKQKEADCPNFRPKSPPCDSTQPQAKKCHEFHTHDLECPGIIPGPTYPGVPVVAGPVPCGPYNLPGGHGKSNGGGAGGHSKNRRGEDDKDEWCIPTLRIDSKGVATPPVLEEPVTPDSAKIPSSAISSSTDQSGAEA